MSLRCLTQSRKTAGHNDLSEESQLVVVVVHLHCKAGSDAAPRRDRNRSSEKTCAAPSPVVKTCQIIHIVNNNARVDAYLAYTLADL